MARGVFRPTMASPPSALSIGESIVPLGGVPLESGESFASAPATCLIRVISWMMPAVSMAGGGADGG